MMRVLLLVASLVLVGATESPQTSSPPPPAAEHQRFPNEQHQERGQEAEPGTPRPTMPPAVKDRPGDASKSDTSDEKHCAERPWYKDPNWFIFITGAVYALVAVGQLSAIRRQAKISEVAAAVAQRAAAAAETSNAQSREMAERELRAYVCASGATLSCPTLDEPSHVRTPGIGRDVFTVTFRNGGRTPAYNFSGHGNWKEMPRGSRLPADFTYPDVGVDIPILKSVFTVSADSAATLSFPVSPEHVQKCRNRESFLYVYGHADYVDVFAKQHSAPFCYLYGYLPSTAPNRDTFTTYSEHNTPD